MGKRLDEYTKDELIETIKHLKKRKKFGLVWENNPEAVVDQCKQELPVLEQKDGYTVNVKDDLPTNLIIEGDNYHSLSVLNYTHAGKVDVIYIDPPYNTGAANWTYNNRFVDENDTFRHSKWISMMSRRLLLAKSLLKRDGSLICAIDENEHAHLYALLEELFPAHELHTITIVHNPKGIQGTNFSYIHEYAIFVIPKNTKTVEPKKLDEAEIYVSNLRNWGGESLRSDAKNCFYPIIVKDNEIVGFGEIAPDSYHPKSSNVAQKDGSLHIWPVDPRGIERKWRYARQSVESIREHLRVRGLKKKDVMIAKDFGTYKTVWIDKRYDASEYGTKLLRKIVPDGGFDFPKSLYTVYDCIYAIIAKRPDSVVLDFFAGSGTTGHAVMQLNNEDGGRRRFILCTNNEGNIAESVTYPRIKNVIRGYSNVEGIPANLRYFKTSFVSRSNVTDDTRYELVKRSSDMICVKENTYIPVLDNEHIKIFKGEDHYTGILFDIDYLQDMKAEIKNLDNIYINLYVFSLTNDTYDEDFADIENKHKLCPIPESILEVYRRIFKETPWN